MKGRSSCAYPKPIEWLERREGGRCIGEDVRVPSPGNAERMVWMRAAMEGAQTLHPLCRSGAGGGPLRRFSWLLARTSYRATTFNALPPKKSVVRVLTSYT